MDRIEHRPQSSGICTRRTAARGLTALTRIGVLGTLGLIATQILHADGIGPGLKIGGVLAISLMVTGIGVTFLLTGQATTRTGENTLSDPPSVL